MTGNVLPEYPVDFACGGARLYGVLHAAARPAERGVLIVVGGPQYRVGSHRQFVLLARALARSGFPVLRFDYRGMGDSEGDVRSFEAIDSDIRSAVEHFCELQPSLRQVVLWGLCDAASAALFYGASDARVAGLVLANPWVRTEAGIAKAYLRHYYVGHLFSRELWQKIGRGEFQFASGLRSLFGMLTTAFRPAPSEAAVTAGDDRRPLPDRMRDGLQRFTGRVLIILSGDDLTAAEFKDLTQRSRAWRRLLGEKRVVRRELPEANHTFARREWRDRVAAWTEEWLRSW